jgi:hypothetical protein
MPVVRSASVDLGEKTLLWSVIRLIQDDYEIVSVESTMPPQQMTGTGWQCYVIRQGTNTIRGYQQGSLEAVRQSVEDIVTRLNERRLGKRGLGYLDTSNHGKAVERR